MADLVQPGSDVVAATNHNALCQGLLSLPDEIISITAEELYLEGQHATLCSLTQSCKQVQAITGRQAYRIFVWEYRGRKDRVDCAMFNCLTMSFRAEDIRLVRIQPCAGSIG